jgi:SAM-dependent methyltransferase
VTGRAAAYDDEFFDWVDSGVARSARPVLSAAIASIRPNSVVDVGCGRGGWLAVWQELGVSRIAGIDGAHVNRDRLAIPREAFTMVDLSEARWPLDERFDLAQSLEVAEHLPPSSADSFVENLVRLSDVVLFSAATPGQGGAMHLNEREHEYWASLFFRHGYRRYDCIRPILSAQRRVEPWYRYNCFVYANEIGARRLEPAALVHLVAPGRTPRQFEDLGWLMRRAILRALPRPAVDLLSRVNYRVQTRRRARSANAPGRRV